MTFKPTSGLTREGMRRISETSASAIPNIDFRAAVLTTQQRKNLSKSSFVFPDKAPGSGSYPIHDRTHAANALSRASGKPEYAAVKRKVCSRYPDLPACKGD